MFNNIGNLIGSQLYGPYGDQRYSNGTLPTTIGFTGQQADSVTGLDYYNARYYDPAVGQFLSADTVQGNAQGADPYSYVGGNPETRTDPTGNRFISGNGEQAWIDPSTKAVHVQPHQTIHYPCGAHATCPGARSPNDVKHKSLLPSTSQSPDLAKADSDELYGQGRDGLQNIKGHLYDVSTNIGEANAAANSSDVDTDFAAWFALLAAIAGPLGLAALATYGTLLSAAFGVASLSDSPGASALTEEGEALATIRGDIQDILDGIPSGDPALKVGFLLTETDTYAQQAVMHITATGQSTPLTVLIDPSEVPEYESVGYTYAGTQTNYNDLVSVAFTLTDFAINTASA